MSYSSTTIDDCQMVTSTSTTPSGIVSQVVPSISISTSLLPPPSALMYQNQGNSTEGRRTPEATKGNELLLGGFSNDLMSNEKLMGILDEVLTLIDDSEDLFAGTLSMQS